MFLFKKIVSQLFFPLPLCLSICLAGVLVLWLTRRQTIGKLLVTAGIGLLMLLSLDPVSSRLLAPLEHRYSAYSVSGPVSEPIRFIVVLGGGHNPDPDLPLTSRLSSSSLARLIEAVRLYHRHPNSRLILSGGAPFGSEPESGTLCSIARELGVPESDMILESESRDTKDQARFIKSVVGDAPFLLVTSASHMPRAMALFEKQGMNPIAAPTDHLARTQPIANPADYFPNSGALKRAERTVYEYLGLLWAKIRGQI